MTAKSSSAGMKIITRKVTDELNPNGNNVVIEEEVAKVAANQADYTMTMNLYSKTIALFKTASGSQGSGG